MNRVVRAVLLLGAVLLLAAALAARARMSRVDNAVAEIPVYPGAREGGGAKRYFPRVVSWEDRSSARVRRVFALQRPVRLTAVARHAHATLAQRGWYLVNPGDLHLENPQVIVWQREPDERLDLTQLWPLSGVAREQRLYGGIFQREFLDASQVIEWNWALGGPRSAAPLSSQ